jgi:putative membrane protein
MSMRGVMAKAAGGLVIAFGAGHMNALYAQGLQTDQQLVSQVAADNLLEVRLGQFAEKKGASPAVKEFGKRMLIDHTSMQKQWMAAAEKNKLQFKADLGPQHLQQAEQLNSLSGSAFDKAYMAAMVQNHQATLNSFQTERNAPHSADIRQLVEAALPTLQEHLTLAQQVATQVGAQVTATTGTPTAPPVATLPSPTTPTTPAVQSVRADSAFISEVDASNAAELRLGRLAQTRATDSVVKGFAQKMVTDHSEMQREWFAVSARNGLPFTGNLSPRHQEQVTRLERLSGTEFDRAYMSAMVQNHQENVNAFQNRGRAAQSSEVRSLVDRGLPLLQEHLTLARQVAGQVGAATPTVVATGTDQGKRGNVNADAKFIREIDADNFLEIRLGRLAEKKARNEAVKQFGRRMVEEHTALQEQWTRMAKNNGMEFKSGMGRRHKSKLTRLEKMSGREFDREYMTLMVQNREDYLSYLRKEGRAANSAPVRQLVDRTIPVLQRQSNQAKQIGGRVGADTTTSRYGRISANNN